MGASRAGPAGRARTLRSAARAMSGNRRQPSRRGQVGPGLTGPSGLALAPPSGPSGGQASPARVPGFLRHPGTFRPHVPHLSPPPQAREKDKMREAKDARYTNGHLFTTISVSGMTMCYACNKSITAKEALICPSKCFAACTSPRLGAHSPDLPVCPSVLDPAGPTCPVLDPLSRGGGGHRAQAGLSGIWGRGGSPCSCRPLGVPRLPEQLPRVRGAGWRGHRNACEAGGGRSGSWAAGAGLAAGSAHLRGRVGTRDSLPFHWPRAEPAISSLPQPEALRGRAEDPLGHPSGLGAPRGGKRADSRNVCAGGGWARPPRHPHGQVQPGVLPSPRCPVPAPPPGWQQLLSLEQH